MVCATLANILKVGHHKVAVNGIIRVHGEEKQFQMEAIVFPITGAIAILDELNYLHLQERASQCRICDCHSSCVFHPAWIGTYCSTWLWIFPSMSGCLFPLQWPTNTWAMVQLSKHILQARSNVASWSSFAPSFWHVNTYTTPSVQCFRPSFGRTNTLAMLHQWQSSSSLQGNEWIR